MSGRSNKHHQQQEHKGKDDMTGPRSKLEGVLQNLVEKADEERQPTELELSPVIIKTEPEPECESTETSSPSNKRPSNRSRKKRKRELPASHVDSDLLDGARLQHSYVMKLFDRSVDLAKFKSSSSLYPVCREWMLNKPAGQRGSRDRTPSPEPLDDSDDNSSSQPNVYRLPRPSKLASYLREETGQYPRVPVPLPQDESLDMYTDPPKTPSKEELLGKNVSRWKKVRSSWKASAQYNQARYNESYAILKAMYERQ